MDLSVCLIAIRAVLEKICKERGSKKKNLEAMLKEMVNKNIFPETLDQCSFLIRKLGNSGAHGDDIDMSQSDVLELIDFIEQFKHYNPDSSTIQINPNKCTHCIYCNLCDKTETNNVYT